MSPLFVFHKAIHIPGLQHNLLCPMQICMNGIQASENPKFLSALPTYHDHALLLPDQTGYFETGNTRDPKNWDINRGPYLIPLLLHGVTSYLPTRKPNIAEADFPSNQSFEVTYESPEWDPHAIKFTKQKSEFNISAERFRESGDEWNLWQQYFSIPVLITHV